MKISLLTLFPEYFAGPLESSILKRAQAQHAVEFAVVNLRDFATDAHRTTDDRPYGGGAGMVLMVEPIARALAAIQPQWPDQSCRRILTSAKGTPYTQATARALSQVEDLVIICGHYEGVDERVSTHFIDEEVRIGEYVLTGGEPAAAVIADSITRLLPGVLGNQESLMAESHDEPGFLAAPQYTRPAEFQGWQVPEVLLGGNHAEIERWREAQRAQQNHD